MAGKTLFTNQTIDGDSSVFDADNGGKAKIRVFGNFDGATVQVQMAFRDADYVSLEDGDFTTAGAKDVLLQTGMSIRLNLSSAGASTDITADFIDG